MSEANDKYTMKISRLTIDKLGIQMYDRVSAVLAELIANAYDADASQVTISLPFGKMLVTKEKDRFVEQGYEITLSDNGSGMTATQVNDFYLNVGYDRRAKRGEVSPKFERRVLGRKGIGKLAPFGICHEVEVISAGGEKTEDGFQVSNLILNLDKMLEDETDEHGIMLPYHPDRGQDDETYKDTAGTTLILRRFNRKRVPVGEELDRQLSARFGLSRENWEVRLEDSTGKHDPIELGTLNVEKMPGTCIDVSTKPLVVDNRHLPMVGWIAYAKDPYKDEVMAGVRIYARGKIVAQSRDFDIRAGFTGEYKMRSYLTGEIHAEWLDEKDDFIQTDRQDIIWNSDVGIAFREWGQKLLKQLAAGAETSIRKRAWDVFLKESKLDKRLEVAFPKAKDQEIRESILKAAKALVSGASGDSIRNPELREEMVRLAYAIGPHHALLALLKEIASSSDGATDIILDLFEQANLVEIFSLGQVAYERVRVIEQLRKLVSSPSTVERDLQKLIEDAQWILYPDWTPLSKNQTLKTTQKGFESWYHAKYGEEIVTATIRSPQKRADFVMLNHARRLEVIEIKRPKRPMTNQEFITAHEYLSVMREFISDNDEVKQDFSEARLTIVCDELNLNSVSKELIHKASDSITCKTWQDLFAASSRSHEDFLEEVDRFQGELPELTEESE